MIPTFHYGKEVCDADECAELGLFFCSTMESEPEEEVQATMAHGHYFLQQQAPRQRQQQ